MTTVYIYFIGCILSRFELFCKPLKVYIEKRFGKNNFYFFIFRRAEWKKFGQHPKLDKLSNKSSNCGGRICHKHFARKSFVDIRRFILHNDAAPCLHSTKKSATKSLPSKVSICPLPSNPPLSSASFIS